MPTVPIADAEILYRRAAFKTIIGDHVTSGLFRTTHEDGCSTFSGSHVTPEQVLNGFEGKGLVSVTGLDVRECGGSAVRDPDQPEHVLLKGPAGFPKRLAARARILALPAAPPEPGPPVAA